MSSEPRRSGTLPMLGGLIAGFLLAVLLLVDPLHLHPLNERFVSSVGAGAQTETSESGLWTCGMHPHVIQDEPGQCPICHMDLVPLRSGHSQANPIALKPGARNDIWTCPDHPMIEEPASGECPIGGRELVLKEDESTAGKLTTGGAVVRIDPAVVQNMNVQTELVRRRNIEQHVRTVGSLEFDQQRMVTVTTKYAGWVEKVHVNYVGEPVTKGAPLFEIYSPELVQTEQELLSALQFARRMQGASQESRQRAEALVTATRLRLSYWDISPDQIAELERTGEVFRTLTVTAPASGLIMKRMDSLEGMAVQPGMQTFHIANLKSLWLSVDVFEDQVAWIREGTPAAVTFTYFPGETFQGTVRYLEPALSETTRTLKVKLEVPNPGGRLRAGMFATVIFQPVAVKDALTVPSLAVLRTGERSLVMVDLGGGRFEPREVVLGLERQGVAEVLQGLEEGERVVTSAQFLLDSESSLQAAIQQMIAQAGGGDAG